MNWLERSMLYFCLGCQLYGLCCDILIAHRMRWLRWYLKRDPDEEDDLDKE
jgi:hypothetical protein